MTGVEQKLKALDFFKDWTNYLLVTTVAALGWTSAKDAATFSATWLRAACILTFAISIVFAIFTLALIPHIGEDLAESDSSIYEVKWKWKGWKWCKWKWLRRPLRLTHLCFWQHLFFLAGIVIYACGTFLPPASPH